MKYDVTQLFPNCYNSSLSAPSPKSKHQPDQLAPPTSPHGGAGTSGARSRTPCRRGGEPFHKPYHAISTTKILYILVIYQFACSTKHATKTPGGSGQLATITIFLEAISTDKFIVHTKCSPKLIRSSVITSNCLGLFNRKQRHLVSTLQKCTQ